MVHKLELLKIFLIAFLKYNSCISQSVEPCGSLPVALDIVLNEDSLYKEFVFENNGYGYIIIDTSFTKKDRLSNKEEIRQYFSSKLKLKKIELKPKSQEEIFMLNIRKWLEFDFIICYDNFVTIYLSGYRLYNQQCDRMSMWFSVNISGEKIGMFSRSDWQECK